MTGWVMIPRWHMGSLAAVTQFNISLSRLRSQALRTPSHRQLHSLPLVHSFDVMCPDDFPSWLGEECLTDCDAVTSLKVFSLLISLFRPLLKTFFCRLYTFIGIDIETKGVKYCCNALSASAMTLYWNKTFFYKHYEYVEATTTVLTSHFIYYLLTLSVHCIQLSPL